MAWVAVLPSGSGGAVAWVALWLRWQYFWVAQVAVLPVAWVALWLRWQYFWVAQVAVLPGGLSGVVARVAVLPTTSVLQ